jgi:hypothetical protein
MSYIYPPETALGVVDSFNKTFTLSRNIYAINYVVVDGVIYTGNVAFVPGTDTFLLEDAPIHLSPEVAYYDSAPSMPTGTGITVAEARAEFLQRKKDTSDIDSIAGTFLKWCNYVNRFAYRELTNIQPEQYIRTQNYTITPDVATYPLPSDFDNISSQGTGFYLVDSNGVATDTRLPPSSFGATMTGRFLNSTAFTVTPMPTQTKQYVLRYIPILPDLTTETDEFVIPKKFSYHLMDVLDACYNVWDEDSGAEVFNDERVIRSMQEMVTHIVPDGQCYSMPDFTSTYYFL